VLWGTNLYRESVINGRQCVQGILIESNMGGV